MHYWGNKMKKHWTVLLRCLFLTGIGLLVSVCAATPDPNSPGNCTLSCGGAKIAGNNARIRFLGGTSWTGGCIGDFGQALQPIPIQFVIEQPAIPPLPASDIPAGTGNEPKPTPFSSDVGTPISGIAFESFFVGGARADVNPGDTAEKYKGISTHQDEWCTDSCGIGTIEVVPTCIPTKTNIINLQIHSGSTTANYSITLDSK